MRDAGLRGLPQFVETAGLDDGEDVAFAVAEAFAVGRGFRGFGEEVAAANDGGEFVIGVLREALLSWRWCSRRAR